MPSDNAEMLEFKEHWKSDKTLSFIYANLQSLIKKIDGCKNNSEKPSTIKVTKNSPCGYSMYLIWTFHGIENKHNVYRGKQCIKKFSESLKEHAMKKINFEKKIIPLTNKEYKSWSNCHLCKKKKWEDNYTNYKIYCEVRDHCHYTDKYIGPAHSICNLKNSITQKNPLVHNGLNYDYHFAVKELTKKFEGKLNCLRENTVSNNNKKKLKELVKMEKKLQKTYECYLSALVNIKTLKII